MSTLKHADLVRHHLRLREVEHGWVLEADIVAWGNSHTPVACWVEFRRWNTCPTEEEAAHAQKLALTDRDLFGRCRLCGETLPRGLMHEEEICQSCAETHLGVVH